MDSGNHLTNIEETESWLSSQGIEFTVRIYHNHTLDSQACSSANSRENVRGSQVHSC